MRTSNNGRHASKGDKSAKVKMRACVHTFIEEERTIHHAACHGHVSRTELPIRFTPRDGVSFV